MKIARVGLLLCVLCLGVTLGCFSSGSSSGGSGGGSTTTSIGERIANKADSYRGSTKWSKANNYGPGSGKNKCNWFVADVIKEAGGSVPHRHWYMTSPIGAGEWGNSRSSYLTSARCWSNVSSPRRGDVAGDGRHVGIVTSSYQTTSANEFNVAKKSSFGTVYWRYTPGYTC